VWEDSVIGGGGSSIGESHQEPSVEGLRRGVRLREGRRFGGDSCGSWSSDAAGQQGVSFLLFFSPPLAFGKESDSASNDAMSELIMVVVAVVVRYDAIHREIKFLISILTRRKLYMDHFIHEAMQDCFVHFIYDGLDVAINLALGL
jgi:hypothetical protein